jgi:uncharacterized protein YjbJ (UPF0337 family)
LTGSLFTQRRGRGFSEVRCVLARHMPGPARLVLGSSGHIYIYEYLQAPEGGGVSVPGRSSREDKNEAAMDRAKGRMKEAGGALTGDKSTKREGRSDQRKGKAKEKKGNLKDLLS